jgi:hypothetical protein
MFGRTVTNYTYYSCQPRERAIPDGHPTMVSVTEEVLLDFTDRFFNTYVLGPDRVQLAAVARHTVRCRLITAADCAAPAAATSGILGPTGSRTGRWRPRTPAVPAGRRAAESR